MNRKTNGVNALLIANIAIFATRYFLPDLQPYLYNTFALYFPLNQNFGPWQLFTHMFMHGNPPISNTELLFQVVNLSTAHIVFNMLALFSFGSILEQIWGTKKFLIFYLAAGLGAGAIHTLVNQLQFHELYQELIKHGLPEDYLSYFLYSEISLAGVSEETTLQIQRIFFAPTVGASGAIYGILVAFGITYPNAKLSVMFIPVPIAAKFLIPAILTLDLFSGVTGFSLLGGGIAHFAHIGGALIGFILMLAFNKMQKNKDPKFSIIAND